MAYVAALHTATEPRPLRIFVLLKQRASARGRPQRVAPDG